MWQLRLNEFAAILSPGNEENQELRDGTASGTTQTVTLSSFTHLLGWTVKLVQGQELGSLGLSSVSAPNLCDFGPSSPFSEPHTVIFNRVTL